MNAYNQDIPDVSFRVFPLRPNDKRPAHTGWQQEARYQPMEKWAGNIGVATGDGLCVIDVDVKHGDGFLSLSEAAKRLGPLPKTFTVSTPSGGKHFYYRVDCQIKNTSGRLGDNIDTRGDGGYVVGPGSVIERKTYIIEHGIPLAELPTKWIDAIMLSQRDTRREPLPAKLPEPKGEVTPYGLAALKGECTVLANAVEGSRNNTLNIVAVKIGKLVAGGEISEPTARAALKAAAISTGLPEQEIELTMASGLAKGKQEPRTAAPRAPASYERFNPKTPDEPTISSQAEHNTEPGTEPDMEDQSPGAPAPGAPEWTKSLIREKGAVTKAAGNVALILAHHEAWYKVIAWDEIRYQIVWSGKAPRIPGFSQPAVGSDFEDANLVYIGHWLALNYGITPTTASIDAAVHQAAIENKVNAMRGYYNSLVWDGQTRVDKWLTTYFGVKDDRYSNSVGRWWLISVVARALQPGCQADHMIVIEGKQGPGKSQALKALAGEWGMGELPDLRNKDAKQAIRGKGIIEISELDAFHGQAATRIKNFLSLSSDDYRPPYGKYEICQKRTCVFAGTTNEKHYLQDPTGNRRFWPVASGKIDIEAIRRDRDQLFAEARQLYAQGAAWWPTEDDQMDTTLADVQDDRTQQDAWIEPVTDWLANRLTDVSIMDCAGFALSMDKVQVDRSAQMRIGAILRRCGYERFRKRTTNGLIYVYRKISEITKGVDDENQDKMR